MAVNRDSRGRFAAGTGARPTQDTSQQQQAHAKSAGSDVYAGVEAGVSHDLGPWVETPASSRVSRFRFDHLQRQLQVQWRNNKGDGYLYENIDYEGYRSFARVVSKGKHINAVLNGHTYRPMTPSEYDAPSNEGRRGIGSRLRT